MDIKEAALAVIEDFCRNVVDEKKHIALQNACRDAATRESKALGKDKGSGSVFR